MRDDKHIIRIGNCQISRSAEICAGVVIGKYFRPLIGSRSEDSSERTIVGPNVYIGYYSLVGAGTVIKEGTVIDDFSIVECNVRIGRKTLLIYRGQVCNDARIG